MSKPLPRPVRIALWLQYVQIALVCAYFALFVQIGSMDIDREESLRERLQFALFAWFVPFAISIAATVLLRMGQKLGWVLSVVWNLVTTLEGVEMLLDIQPSYQPFTASWNWQSTPGVAGHIAFFLLGILPLCCLLSRASLRALGILESDQNLQGNSQ